MLQRYFFQVNDKTIFNKKRELQITAIPLLSYNVILITQ